MHVLLILPATRESRANRNKLIAFAPLTLSVLAALVPEEHDVTIVDENAREVDFDLEPDLVGISALAGTINRAYEIAHRFRQKGAATVLGGYYPSIFPEEVSQHVDSVVVGLGYKTWPQCIEDFQRNQALRRIYWPGDTDNIENCPIPRRDLLSKSHYLTRNTIKATTGCPNRCHFCTTPIAEAKYQMRSIENIIDEIKRLKGPLVFVDENLVGRKSFAKRLFREMIPLKREWVATATADCTSDAELLDLAAQSGCRGLFIGLESLNQNNLRESNKKFVKVDAYTEMQRRLRDHGICSALGIMFGFDHDDASVFDATMRFIDRIKADVIRYGVVTPFPGTPLHQRLLDENRIIDPNLDNYDSYHVVFQPKLMTAGQLQEGFLRAMYHTYSLPSIWKRLLGSRSCLRLSVPVNIGYHINNRRLKKQIESNQFYLPGCAPS